LALFTKTLFVTTFWSTKNLVLSNFVEIVSGVVQTKNGSETNSTMMFVMDTGSTGADRSELSDLISQSSREFTSWG
jgi:hypothetical protein